MVLMVCGASMTHTLAVCGGILVAVGWITALAWVMFGIREDAPDTDPAPAIGIITGIAIALVGVGLLITWQQIS